VAEPKAVFGAHISGTRHHLGCRSGIFDVQGEICRSSNDFIELAQSGDMAGKVCRQRFCNRTSKRTTTNEAVMIKDGYPVCSDPDVALEPRRT
jgi:hypothetical protein